MTNQTSEIQNQLSPIWRRIRYVAVFLFFVAALSRLSYLGIRAFHHDESLDAWFSLQYLDGSYKGYDPVYHGPLRFYLNAAFFWLFGQSDSIARLLPALSGIWVVLLPWFWRRNLGPIGTPMAMTLVLVSPTMLYFSRFGREDSFFLLLTFLTVITIFSFLNTPKRWHPTVLLILFVLGLAVKESAFLTVFIFGSFAMVLFAQDLFIASFSQYRRKATQPDYKKFKQEIVIEGVNRRTISVQSKVLQPITRKKVSEESIRRVFLVAGLFLMFAVFLWIGTNPGQQKDLPTLLKLGVYGTSLAIVIFACAVFANRSQVQFSQIPTLRSLRVPRATGWILGAVVAGFFFTALFTQFFQHFDGPGSITAPHGAIRNGLTSGFEYWLGEQATVRGDSRWQYYLVLLLAYEWLAIALAVVGVISVIRKPNLFGQVIVWWACASLLIYSWAGERMPWLMIHILLPLIILAATGAQSIWDRGRKRLTTFFLGFLIIFGLGYSTVTSAYSSYFLGGGEPQELYVQAGQATPEVPEWAGHLEALDRLSLAHFDRHLEVKIDSDVYWPYGWYLRDFPTSTYAVITKDSFPSNADIIFVPHWDRIALEGDYRIYEEIPYEHRWWWVPEFDSGINGPRQLGDLISSWGSWIWDREPWDSKSGKCPASLSGSVYIKKEIYELGEEYFKGAFPSRGEKPSYGRSCATVSNFLSMAQ